MSTTKSINKKCKITRTRFGDIYIKPKKEFPFKEQVYVSLTAHDKTLSPQIQKKKYSIMLIDGQKAHYVGYKKEGIVPNFPEKVAIKKALSWLKQKGVC